MNKKERMQPMGSFQTHIRIKEKNPKNNMLYPKYNEGKWHVVNDMTPTSPNAPSSPISSASPLKGPITRSMIKKIQKGLPLDDQKFNGLFTLLTWAKDVTKA